MRAEAKALGIDWRDVKNNEWLELGEKVLRGYLTSPEGASPIPGFRYARRKRTSAEILKRKRRVGVSGGAKGEKTKSGRRGQAEFDTRMAGDPYFEGSGREAEIAKAFRRVLKQEVRNAGSVDMDDLRRWARQEKYDKYSRASRSKSGSRVVEYKNHETGEVINPGATRDELLRFLGDRWGLDISTGKTKAKHKKGKFFAQPTRKFSGSSGEIEQAKRIRLRSSLSKRRTKKQTAKEAKAEEALYKGDKPTTGMKRDATGKIIPGSYKGAGSKPTGRATSKDVLDIKTGETGSAAVELARRQVGKVALQEALQRADISFADYAALPETSVVKKGIKARVRERITPDRIETRIKALSKIPEDELRRKAAQEAAGNIFTYEQLGQIVGAETTKSSKREAGFRALTETLTMPKIKGVAKRQAQNIRESLRAEFEEKYGKDWASKRNVKRQFRNEWKKRMAEAHGVETTGDLDVARGKKPLGNPGKERRREHGLKSRDVRKRTKKAKKVADKLGEEATTQDMNKVWGQVNPEAFQSGVKTAKPSDMPGGRAGQGVRRQYKGDALKNARTHSSAGRRAAMGGKRANREQGRDALEHFLKAAGIDKKAHKVVDDVIEESDTPLEAFKPISKRERLWRAAQNMDVINSRPAKTQTRLIIARYNKIDPNWRDKPSMVKKALAEWNAELSDIRAALKQRKIDAEGRLVKPSRLVKERIEGRARKRTGTPAPRTKKNKPLTQEEIWAKRVKEQADKLKKIPKEERRRLHQQRKEAQAKARKRKRYKNRRLRSSD